MSIRDNEKLKAFLLKVIFPKNQARPRWFIRVFVNPFYHSTRGAKIRWSTRMDVVPFNDFRIGKGSTIESYSCVNNGMGPVTIGKNSRIGLGNTLIGPIRIANEVILAQNVVASALNHGYEDINTPIRRQKCTFSEISIDSGTWIGANTTITSGVKIGKNCVIGGGSVVTKNIPDYSIAVGNPAKIIKQFDQEKKCWVKVS